MATITINGTFHGDELKDIPVINPGDWFGKTSLIEIGGSYSPLFLIVEADSISDAIDELADHWARLSPHREHWKLCNP